MTEIDKNKIVDLLKRLNEENYLRLNLGRNDIVSAVERSLCRVEQCIFGNTDIQDKLWREYLNAMGVRKRDDKNKDNPYKNFIGKRD